MSKKGVALVTGSAQGIGKAIALRLAQDGFDVGLNDLPGKEDLLRVLQEEITSIGRECTIVMADISSEEQVQGMVDNTVDTLGSLEVMVANGGMFLPGSLLDISVEDWDRTFSVNCRGTFLCYKYAAKQMIKQGRGGRIIGASSDVGKQGMAMMGAYSSTKFGIRGLTQVAAQEFGKHGITVNAYAPGVIDTELMRTSAAGVMPTDPAGMLEMVKSRTAVGFLGRPDDIASFVAYIVGPESGYVTGQTISINGGWHYD